MVAGTFLEPFPLASEIWSQQALASIILHDYSLAFCVASPGQDKRRSGSGSISGVIGSSVRKVRIQGRVGDEDRRISFVSPPVSELSEAVRQLSDGFPFDRRLIEVPSSPGLWPDCLERFLQFEAVVFYECKTDRPRSQPSHRTGSVRTIFLQDVISSLQTSAPEEFHASPECHPSP
jgi:hypothetical protein